MITNYPTILERLAKENAKDFAELQKDYESVGSTVDVMKKTIDSSNDVMSSLARQSQEAINEAASKLLKASTALGLTDQQDVVDRINGAIGRMSAPVRRLLLEGTLLNEGIYLKSMEYSGVSIEGGPGIALGSGPASALARLSERELQDTGQAASWLTGWLTSDGSRAALSTTSAPPVSLESLRPFIDESATEEFRTFFGEVQAVGGMVLAKTKGDPIINELVGDATAALNRVVDSKIDAFTTGQGLLSLGKEMARRANEVVGKRNAFIEHASTTVQNALTLERQEGSGSFGAHLSSNKEIRELVGQSLYANAHNAKINSVSFLQMLKNDPNFHLGGTIPHPDAFESQRQGQGVDWEALNSVSPGQASQGFLAWLWNMSPLSLFNRVADRLQMSYSKIVNAAYTEAEKHGRNYDSRGATLSAWGWLYTLQDNILPWANYLLSVAEGFAWGVLGRGITARVIYFVSRLAVRREKMRQMELGHEQRETGFLSRINNALWIVGKIGIRYKDWIRADVSWKGREGEFKKIYGNTDSLTELVDWIGLGVSGTAWIVTQNMIMRGLGYGLSLGTQTMLGIIRHSVPGELSFLPTYGLDTVVVTAVVGVCATFTTLVALYNAPKISRWALKHAILPFFRQLAYFSSVGMVRSTREYSSILTKVVGGTLSPDMQRAFDGIANIDKNLAITRPEQYFEDRFANDAMRAGVSLAIIGGLTFVAPRLFSHVVSWVVTRVAFPNSKISLAQATGEAVSMERRRKALLEYILGLQYRWHTREDFVTMASRNMPSVEEKPSHLIDLTAEMLYLINSEKQPSVVEMIE